MKLNSTQLADLILEIAEEEQAKEQLKEQFEKLAMRVRQMLSYGKTEEEAAQALQDEGVPNEDAYLAVKAAKSLNTLGEAEARRILRGYLDSIFND